MAAPKNKYLSRIEGLLVTIGSLDGKLRELAKRRQNKKEEMRGITEGGASIASPDADTDKDLNAQIAAISEQRSAIEAQKYLNQIFEEASKNKILEDGQDDQKGGGSFKCNSLEEASAMAHEIASTYEKLGFKCNISRDGNVFKVNVEVPKELVGKDPLAMSADELLKARELKDKKLETPNASPKPFGKAEKPFNEIGAGVLQF